MIETLVPLKFPPGIFRNGTRYDAMGRWYNANHMRFVEGYPQPIGGWLAAIDTTGASFPDVANGTGNGGSPAFRSMWAWRTSAGTVVIALGGTNGLAMYTDAGAGIVQNGPTQAGLTNGQVNAAVIGTGRGMLGVQDADSWQMDNFGDFFVGVLSSDRRLLTWNPADPTAQAVVATNAPIANRGVVVTPERFLVALAAGGDPRKVQWADQETTSVWTPTELNQAGEFTLATNGRIMCGARTKQQTLVWTDADVHTMTYVGGELIYSFAQAGDHCGIIGPQAKAVSDTQAFWMGRNNFFKYDGFVQAIPCDVHDYVFEDFNTVQASKVWAMTVGEFSEVWWFYCSAASTEIDRYVIYNYRDGHWSVGSMARTCGLDAGTTPRPLMVSAARKLFEHELGEIRSDTGSGDTSFIESGPVEIDPDHVMRIQRIVPDGAALGDATMTLYTSTFPIEVETSNGPYTLANPTDVRLSAKVVRVKVSGAGSTSWRAGVPRLGVITQGRR